MTTHEIVLSDVAFAPISDGKQGFLMVPSLIGVTLGDKIWLRELSAEGPTGRELVCSVHYLMPPPSDNGATMAFDGVKEGFVSVGIVLERRIKGAKEANHGFFGCPFCKDTKAISQNTEGSQISLACGNCGANWRIIVDVPPTKITVPAPI